MTRNGGAAAVTRPGPARKDAARRGRGAGVAPAGPVPATIPPTSVPVASVPVASVPVASGTVAPAPAGSLPSGASAAGAPGRGETRSETRHDTRSDARLVVAQIVTFRIEQDLFAADVRAVERVLRPTAITPVPNMPAWISGVLEYQKRVVPVIDFRTRFELPAVAPTNETRVLVFNVTGSWVAAVVDAVLDVSALDAARLEAPPPLLRGLAAGYLRGIVRREGRLVMLLDADRLLSATERLVLGGLADAADSMPVTPAPVAAHG